LAVGAGVAPAFPPAGQLSTASATSTLPSRSPSGLFVPQLQLTLTRHLAIPRFRTLPRFACQTTIAAQSIRRKPCGQQSVKPAYSCLKFKTQNHTRLALLDTQKIHRRRISTEIRHR
jgi:hypothetical protein